MVRKRVIKRPDKVSEEFQTVILSNPAPRPRPVIWNSISKQLGAALSMEI